MLNRFSNIETPTFLKQFRTRRTMDGTINPTPAQPHLIGCVDDGIHLKGRDDSLYGSDH